MRNVILIGESIPLRDDGSEYDVTPCGILGDELEPFDARHGVFCNFVTTPLLAAIHGLKQRQESAELLINQLEEILKDKSERRLNIFKRKKKESNEPFVVSDVLADYLSSVRPCERLSLLFGYQTIFGLLAWMLSGQQVSSWTRTEIKEMGFAFLTAASTYSEPIENWPSPVEIEPKTGHIGLIHRLCVEEQGEGMLRHAVVTMAKCEVDTDSIVAFFRSSVPLLHNEAYRQANIGLVQACFVRYATGISDETVTDQYWQVMGRSIAHRFCNEFISR